MRRAGRRADRGACRTAAFAEPLKEGSLTSAELPQTRRTKTMICSFALCVDDETACDLFMR